MSHPMKEDSYFTSVPYGSTLWNNGRGLQYSGRRSALLHSSNSKRGKNGKYIGVNPFAVIHESWNSNHYPLPYQVLNGASGIVNIVSQRSVQLNPLTTSWFAHNTMAQETSARASDFSKGYKLTRPDKTGADVGVFLIEALRDGLPSLPLRLLSRLRTFRSLGSEYLNVQFGWRPFLNDLRKMYHLSHNIHRRLNRLVKNNGVWESRTGTIKNETNSVVTLPGQPGATFIGITGAPNLQNASSIWRRTTVTTDRIWYSSKFKYFTKDIGSPAWTIRATAALFGVSPTPALLWEALPWSWLIDWFSNVGDVMSNISAGAVDNLVYDNQCVMHHSTQEISEVVTSTWDDSKSWSTVQVRAGSCTLTYNYKQESKYRVVSGNPFGLGIQIDQLTPYQTGILAALGLSRQRLL